MKNNVKRWKEPWKNKEPDGRLSERALNDQKAIERQRLEAEENLVLSVRVTCLKTKLYRMGFFNSFNVHVNIPMRYEEIMERMAKAFPELERRKD